MSGTLSISAHVEAAFEIYLHRRTSVIHVADQLQGRASRRALIPEDGVVARDLMAEAQGGLAIWPEKHIGRILGDFFDRTEVHSCEETEKQGEAESSETLFRASQ